MKKKLMMVAALVGVLSLGACVDDKESASVEAVRGAKAEQLKSVAAMNNAEAEAKRVLAASKAALEAAEAEAIKVNSDLTKVQIEIEKVKLEQEKVALELQKSINDIDLQRASAQLAKDLLALENDKAKLELKKNKIANDLKVQALTLEKELLEAEQTLLQAKQDMAASQDGFDAATRRHLNTLADNYEKAVLALNSAKKTLNSSKAYLVELENELISPEQYNKELIAEKNKEIVKYEAQIEIYKQYSNYTEDIDALRNSIDTKRGKMLVAENKNATLQLSYYQKELPYFYNLINENEFVKTAYDYSYYINGWFYSTKDVEVSYKTYWGYYEYNTYQTYEYATVGDLRDLEIRIANQEPVIASLKEDVKAKEKTYNDAVKASADAEKAWKEAAADDKDDALIAYNTARNDEMTAKSDFDYWNDELASQTEDFENLKNALKTLSSAEAYASYKKIVDDYNEAAKAKEETAWLAWQEARDEYYKLSNEWYALYYISNNSSIEYYNHKTYTWEYIYIDSAEDIYLLISVLESNIDILKTEIEELSDMTSIEEAIEEAKVQIALQETWIPVLESHVATTKAALEAALAE